MSNGLTEIEEEIQKQQEKVKIKNELKKLKDEEF
jgi:hypothetical protein